MTIARRDRLRATERIDAVFMTIDIEFLLIRFLVQA